MQKGLWNKKGISPLIATVLLIGATIGIFLIVYALIQGVAVSTIEKSADCGAQEETSLEISGELSCQGNVANITISNNGQVKVEGYRFVLYEGANGHSPPPTLNPTKPAEQTINSLDISTLGLKNCPDRVEIYPGVIKEVGKNKAKFVICKDKKIEVSKS